MRRKRLLVVALCVTGLIITALVVLIGTRRKVLYRVIFLPSLGGGRIIPHAINDRGQVIGTAKVIRGGWRIFRWDKDGGMEDLGPYEAIQNLSYLQINNTGQIAGNTVDPNGVGRAFIRDPNGHEHILGAPGGANVAATALNNRGQVVGYAEAEGGVRQACLWDPALGMRYLGTLGGRESRACSVNDAGQITGFAQTSDTRWHAFRWDPNAGMSDLGFAPSDPMAMCYINNSGFIVGDFGPSKGKRQISVWCQARGARPLRSLVEEFAYVCAPNDTNQFLLRVYRPGFKVFGRAVLRRSSSSLWDPNEGFEVLARRLGRRDAAYFAAMDINSEGHIVGSLVLKGPNLRFGAVLEPIK
jgi:probable HAF family extracellular repeat protein